MKNKMNASLTSLLLASALTGCLDTASVDNDKGSSGPARSAVQGTNSAGGSNSGPATTGTHAGTGAQASAGRGGSNGSMAGKSGGSSAGNTGSGNTDSGNTGSANAGKAGPASAGSSGDMPTGGGDPSLVAGTATSAGCSSYQRPAGGKCGGYFCGVDAATLAKALVPGGKCSGDAAFTCDGRVVNKVGDCARMVKSQMPLVLNNNDLRPAVQACVYQDAEIKQKVPEDCLGCFLDAAVCAADNCLLECLSGDSSMCDACRVKNNCQQPVFACGGLPNPL